MNRQQRLTMADAAATRAASLAREAEKYATHPDYTHKAAPLAEAGVLWAEVAKAHAAIAAVLPETVDENTEV